MKKLQSKKPNIKGSIQKIKHLNKEDVIIWWKAKKERRERIIEQRRNSEFAKKMKPVYYIMNKLSIFLHLFLACVINFVIESISRHSIFQAWNYLVESPLVFLYNAGMIFTTLMVVYMVKRRVFARIIISILWLFLGVCNGYMLIKRVTPFNAQDLKVADDALTLINRYFNPSDLIMLLIEIVAVIIWIVAMWRRGGQFQGKVHRIVAFVGVIVCFVVYLGVTSIAIDKRIVSNYFGNVAFAYEDYGLPYCFMASLFDTGINEPNGYSEEAIKEIGNEDSLIQSETGRAKEAQPNILFIQLESYFDVAEVEFFTTSEDASPNLRAISNQFSSGYFKVPSVGAGTANTEFEVLTGMNLRYFGPGEYPYKTILKEKPTESAATALGALGYGTHALHNNGGNFYSRANVFDNIGFDSYTSKEFMNILQVTENGWSKDDVLIQHILEAMDTTEQSDFVFGISVQGHGEYPEEQRIENPKITVEGIESEAEKNKWEYYVNQVYEMDRFAGDLVQAIEERGEPTVVVFYGDHLPAMGLQAGDLKSRYLYNTDYVIWDNVGLPQEDRNIPTYQIMADVLDRLDIHSGTIFNYHQQRRQTNNYLSDLELLQYDILYGSQYVYKGNRPIEKGHMQMGVLNTSVTEIVAQLGRGYSIYGQNFTKSSKVFIDGEKQESNFLNNTRIELPEAELKDGSIVTVSQVGSSNTVFRTSAEYVFQEGKLTEVEGTGEVKKGVSWTESVKGETLE